MANINVLIEEFIQNVKFANEPINYADKQAVKKHNAATDKYRKTAKKISDETSGVPNQFLILLRSSDENVSIACAVCIIELMKHTGDQYQLAVSAIEKYVKTSKNKINVMGFEIYLKNLKK